MRLLSLTVFIFFLSISASFAFNNSESDDTMSKEDRLYYTCKIWGFLKYYHPLVSKGSFNWDEKLESILNTGAKYRTYSEFSEYLTRWIYYMGEIRPCNNCSMSSGDDAFLKNFDMSWTQDSRLSPELRSSLKNIEKNRFQGDHNYISKGKVGQFEPQNEPEGYNLSWKEENHRLLPLFRYWNYIEYFFPYKYQTDQNWDEVLKEMIPKFLNAQSKLEWHLAMLELVTKVDDSHASLSTPALVEWPYNNYLPARFDVIEDKVIITQIIDKEKALKDDLRVGDVITHVNGKSTGELFDSIEKYISGSNEGAKKRNLYFTLFMGLESPINITIERIGSVKSKSINIYKYSDLSFEKPETGLKWKEVSDSIGYVDMGKITASEVDKMMEEMKQHAVIIFDVRNYPKGTYKAIAKHLKPSKSAFAVFTRPDFSYPGKYRWQGESSCGEENEDYYKGMVILLVNEQTQSHAEFTCMCLQTAPNVVTIGSQTSGADGSVSRFPIFQRHYTTISGIGVFYPDGRETQRIGIVPDISAHPTIDGIREGRDEILEKAIDVANTEIAMQIAKLEALKKAALDSLMADSLRVNTTLPDSLINLPTVDSLEVDSQDY